MAPNYDAEPVAARRRSSRRATRSTPATSGTRSRLTGDVPRRPAAARAQSPARRHGGVRGARAVPPRRRPGDPRSTAAGCRPASDQPEPDAFPPPPEGEVTVDRAAAPGEPLPSSGRSAPEGQVPDDQPRARRRRRSTRGRARRSSRAPTASWCRRIRRRRRGRARSKRRPRIPGPHLSYAIQWILFAIMGFVFIGYVIRTERRHRREDAEDRAGRMPRPAARHRTPRRRARSRRRATRTRCSTRRTAEHGRPQLIRRARSGPRSRDPRGPRRRPAG